MNSLDKTEAIFGINPTHTGSPLRGFSFLDRWPGGQSPAVRGAAACWWFKVCCGFSRFGWRVVALHTPISRVHNSGALMMLALCQLQCDRPAADPGPGMAVGGEGEKRIRSAACRCACCKLCALKPQWFKSCARIL